MGKLIPKVPLKVQNMPTILTFIVMNIALLIAIISSKTGILSEFNSVYFEINEASIITVVSPLFIFVALNMINPDLKAIIVFWKVKNPLPGSYVFSSLIDKDKRIDTQELKSKIGEFPIISDDQNALWYRLYRTVSTSLYVEPSHKKFLLGRELVVLSAEILFVFPLVYLKLAADNHHIYLYIFILIFQYLILCIATQNIGKRFACNVLVEYNAQN